MLTPAPIMRVPPIASRSRNSVDAADGMRGRGVGTALLRALIERCEAGPWRQMIAVVGDSANAGSIALHRRFGFERVGVLQSVGYKLGRWVDAPILQRALGAGDRQAPVTEPGTHCRRVRESYVSEAILIGLAVHRGLVDFGIQVRLPQFFAGMSRTHSS